MLGCAAKFPSVLLLPAGASLLPPIGVMTRRVIGPNGSALNNPKISSISVLPGDKGWRRLRDSCCNGLETLIIARRASIRSKLPVEPRIDYLFRNELMNIINMQRELVRLADLIDWSVLDRESGAQFVSTTGDRRFRRGVSG
jgi:hypothetical protein